MDSLTGVAASVHPPPPASLRPSHPPGYSQSDEVIVRASNAANVTRHLQELQPGQEGRAGKPPVRRSGPGGVGSRPWRRRWPRWRRKARSGSRPGCGVSCSRPARKLERNHISCNKMLAWWTNCVITDARSLTTLARTWRPVYHGCFGREGFQRINQQKKMGAMNSP